MDALFNLMDHAQTALTAIPLLMLFAALAAAWFPGHNARRWGHYAASLVRACGWTLGGAGFVAWTCGYFIPFLPGLVLLWVALVVFSYGKSPSPLRRLSALNAFEVIFAQPEETDDQAIAGNLSPT